MDLSPLLEDVAAGPASQVCVGLGANLGDPVATLTAALAAIARWPGTALLASSGFYRSAPVDAEGPDFVNAAALLRTTLTPLACLRELQGIEAAHRRERPRRNAPRTLDLDLLLWGGESLTLPDLVVPHPRMHERAFVLRPLADIWPDCIIPGQGAVRELLAKVAGQRIEKMMKNEERPE